MHLCLWSSGSIPILVSFIVLSLIIHALLFFPILVVVCHYLDSKDTFFKQQQSIYLRLILH